MLPSSAAYITRTALLLMVMPRSCSMSIESSIWDDRSLSSTVWVSSRILSEMVDLPWSMCATIEKLRMSERSVLFMRPIITHECVGQNVNLCPHLRTGKMRDDTRDAFCYTP